MHVKKSASFASKAAIAGVFLLSVSVLTLAAPSPALADAMRSNVAFNNGIGQKTANQPADGVEVAYQIKLAGGDLDGCLVDVVEQLRPRDEGKWGLFDILGKVSCGDKGGFAYASAGSWDGNGFHAAGVIEEGSGSGGFAGIKGRVAQLNGSAKGAANGTADIAYELVVDKAG